MHASGLPDKNNFPICGMSRSFRLTKSDASFLRKGVSMFSSNSNRRVFTQNASALLFVFCLFLAPFLTGCETEAKDDDFSVNGTWVFSSEYGSEIYIIDTDNNRFEYEGGLAFKGTIHEVTFFTSNSGVIIIEYDEDAKPEYYEIDWNPPYDVISGPHDPIGNFLGVYFINLKADTVKLANATDTTFADLYYRCEAETLEAAKVKFTADNIDDFIFDWSYVSTQVKQK